MMAPRFHHIMKTFSIELVYCVFRYVTFETHPLRLNIGLYAHNIDLVFLRILRLKTHPRNSQDKFTSCKWSQSQSEFGEFKLIKHWSQRHSPHSNIRKWNSLLHKPLASHAKAGFMDIFKFNAPYTEFTKSETTASNCCFQLQHRRIFAIQNPKI